MAGLLTVLLLVNASGASAQEAPAPAPADTLTLADAVRIALTGSPAIREAQAGRTAASAGRWEGWGRLLPSLQLSTGLNQSEVLQRTATDPVTGGIVNLPDSSIALRQSFGTSAALSASWTLFSADNLWNVGRARAESRAGNFALEAAHARVAAGVTLAYLDALEAAAVEAWRRADLERAAELTRLAVGRYEVGQAPQLDVLQARLVEGEAELALLEAESAAEAARLALFEFLDLPAGSRVALGEPPAPALGTLPDADELREQVFEESAELAALRAERSVAAAGVRAERWWFLPTVSVGATWIRSEFGQTRDALTFEPRNEQAYYQLSFSWSPLDQPGSLVANRRRAQAALQTADARLEARRAALVREVEVALAGLRRAQLLRDRSELNLELAARQREQAAERYRLGVASIIEQIQAEALARDAERQAIAARYAALRALAELQQAAGVRLLS